MDASSLLQFIPRGMPKLCIPHPNSVPNSPSWMSIHRSRCSKTIKALSDSALHQAVSNLVSNHGSGWVLRRGRCDCRLSAKASIIEETEANEVSAEDEVNDGDKNENGGYTFVTYSREKATAFATLNRKYIILENVLKITYVFNYILGGQMHGFLTPKEEFFNMFANCVSSGFDPDTDLVQVCILAQEYHDFGDLLEKVMIHKYGLENIEEHFKYLNTSDVVQVIDIRQVLSRTSIIVVPYFEEGEWHHMIGGDSKKTIEILGPNKGFILYEFYYACPKERMLDDKVISLLSGSVYHGSIFVASFYHLWQRRKIHFTDPNPYDIAADLSRNLSFLELSCLITVVDLEAHGGNSTMQAYFNGGKSIVTLAGFQPVLAGTGTEYMMEILMSTVKQGRAINEEEAYQLVNKALTRAYQKDTFTGGYMRIDN